MRTLDADGNQAVTFAEFDRRIGRHIALQLEQQQEATAKRELSILQKQAREQEVLHTTYTTVRHHRGKWYLTGRDTLASRRHRG